MQVKKRNGNFEEVSLDKILRRIEGKMEGLNRSFVDPVEIATKVVQGLTDGIKTSDLDILAAETASILTGNHPDFSKLAARIALSNLYKETPDKFSKCVKYLEKHTKLLSTEFCEIVKNNKDLIDNKIDHSRDEMFDYFGFKTLEKGYLLRRKDKFNQPNVDEVVERPQYMWMRVALGIWGNNIEEAFKVYDELSNGYYIHATPTLFNAGTHRPQLSSCFLISNKGDSIEGITESFTEVAKISAAAGGIGLHIHDLRARGSYIKGSGGTAHGIIPYLKSMNEWSRYWDQGGGKRRGSFAIYLEPWHKDIFEFLDIRKNHGKEEMRARDLFTALWIPDLFMKRVEANDKWTLFCPNEVLLATGKSLQDTHSEEFDKLYLECENLNIGKEIKARDLWNHILEAQIEGGTPYMSYKDACNSKSNQQNLGTIKSSNLCQEVVEFSSAQETGTCNLASIALPKFLEGGIFNFEKLRFITQQIVKNLNKVIDINYYPVETSKLSNMLHRPVGIGVQGLSDVFAILGYAFDSKEAKELNIRIFENIYYAALYESMLQAKEFGKYSSYEGSPISKGIFQFDMYSNKPELTLDWDGLRKEIQIFGIRNSLLLAPMPTVSTSTILSNNECFEPYNSNISTRSSLAGTFTIINKYLIKDLESINLWNKDIKNKLILEKGSVQNIPEIPVELKERYKTAYEISQKVIIDMAADRQRFICQSQSMNIFMANPNIGKLSSMHFYGWKAGLKTGMYYLRTKAAADAIQFTVEKDNKEALNCSIDNKDDCESCGS